MIHITSLLAKTNPKAGNVTFVAVDGHGGSGKSTFAELLSKELKAEIIHTDDFASWDNPIDWYPILIEKIFIPIASGKESLSYKRSQWWGNHAPVPVSGQPVTPIMILEGVSSARNEFKDYISLSFFVDTPRDICLQRGVERDKATGKSKEELTRIWNGWFDEEDKYFERDNPKESADVVIDGTKPFSEQVIFD